MGLYDYLDNNKISGNEFKNLQTKNSNIKKKIIHIPRNNRYHVKKKHRKRYYRKHVNKPFKHRKALLNKKEYNEKLDKTYWESLNYGNNS